MDPVYLFVELPPEPGPADIPKTAPGFFVFLSADGLSYFVQALDRAAVFPWAWPGRPRPATAADLAAAIDAGQVDLWPADPAGAE